MAERRSIGCFSCTNHTTMQTSLDIAPAFARLTEMVGVRHRQNEMQLVLVRTCLPSTCKIRESHLLRLLRPRQVIESVIYGCQSCLKRLDDSLSSIVWSRRCLSRAAWQQTLSRQPAQHTVLENQNSSLAGVHKRLSTDTQEITCSQVAQTL